MAAAVSAALRPGVDGALQEEADEVAVATADLLAHDDLRRSTGQLGGTLCAVDALVVGDGQVREAQAQRPLDHGCRVGQRIERRPAVAVQVREAPGTVGRATGRRRQR